MVEQKAAIAMLDVPASELERVSLAFGYTLVSSTRLTGGFSSSNFRAELVPTAGGSPLTAVLKFSYAAMPREELDHQLEILDLLQRSAFPTNYLMPRLAASADATLSDRFLVTAPDGGGPWALLVGYFDGLAGDKLLARASAEVTHRMLHTLGATLGQLHSLPLVQQQAGRIRPLSVGFPVCNTGELLSEDGAVDKLLAEVHASFAPFLQERLHRFRTLYGATATGLPTGFIHGDAYLDNALFEPSEGRLLALIDWEDSCVAPFALDLAVCLSAAAFTADNELLAERCKHVLAGYATPFHEPSMAFHHLVQPSL